MLIGFGFGPPLVSILMLLATLGISYGIFRLSARKRSGPPSGPSSGPPSKRNRDALRAYYYRQRQRAREMAQDYDLTDEEIEQKIDEELGPRL